MKAYLCRMLSSELKPNLIISCNGQPRLNLILTSLLTKDTLNQFLEPIGSMLSKQTLFFSPMINPIIQEFTNSQATFYLLCQFIELSFHSESNSFGFIKHSFLGARPFSSNLFSSPVSRAFRAVYCLILTTFFLYLASRAVLRVLRFIKKSSLLIKEFLLIFLQFAVLAAIGLGIILTFKGLGHGETSETKTHSNISLRKYMIFVALFYALYFFRFLAFSERGLHYAHLLSPLVPLTLASTVLILIFVYHALMLLSQQSRSSLDLPLRFLQTYLALTTTNPWNFQSQDWISDLLTIVTSLLALNSVLLVYSVQMLESVRLQSRYFAENGQESQAIRGRGSKMV